MENGKVAAGRQFFHFLLFTKKTGQKLLCNFVIQSAFKSLYVVNISTTLDKLHGEARSNKWLFYFAVFSRVALAAGFIPSGLVKIFGIRFTSLSPKHPMGHYLEALFHTGFYYPFIGVVQFVAAILLLLPATAALGAVLYFPVILNICVLSLSLRFEGSLLTSPLMVLANLYLLCWYYDRWKFILPFNRLTEARASATPAAKDGKFPLKFFTGVVLVVTVVVLALTKGPAVMPRNTVPDCRMQFKGTNRMQAGYRFCDCIHKEGRPLDSCLLEYDQAPDDPIRR
jgi:hypothetical protein